MKQLYYRLRPINLLIVALTQLSIYHLLLKPIHVALDIENIPELMDFHYYIIIGITCIICFGGYIINDIFDVDIDKINKPHRAIQQLGFWMRIYKILFLSGLGLTIYLSFLCNTFLFPPIYILAWTLLWMYSKTLKCSALWGNFVVALFSTSVILALFGPGFPIYLEIETSLAQEYFSSFLLYGIMSFLVSLIREIVKDMEDIDGDKKQDCKTLPVAVGSEKTKVFVAFFSLLLMLSLAAFAYHYYVESRMMWTISLSIFTAWMLLLVMFVLRARGPKGLHFVQQNLKLIMILGILLLILEPYVDYWLL